MKVIKHLVSIEVNSELEEQTVRATLDKYHLTADGVKFIDVEVNKSFSIYKATLLKFVKRII